jgi:hypothetical protein
MSSATSQRKARLFSTALLWLGVLALALHSLAGIVHSSPKTSAEGLIQICTPQGMVDIDSATGTLSRQPFAPQGDSQLRCCDLCAACAVPAIAAGNLPIAFNVAHASIDAQAPPLNGVVHADHPALTPLVPRGPPVLS